MPAAHTKAYKSVLNHFASYRDGIQYDKDHAFDPAYLSAITSDYVEKWMSFRAFSMPEPNADDVTTLYRSSTFFLYRGIPLI